MIKLSKTILINTTSPIKINNNNNNPGNQIDPIIIIINNNNKANKWTKLNNQTGPNNKISKWTRLSNLSNSSSLNTLIDQITTTIIILAIIIVTWISPIIIIILRCSNLRLSHRDRIIAMLSQLILMLIVCTLIMRMGLWEYVSSNITLKNKYYKLLNINFL